MLDTGDLVFLACYTPGFAKAIQNYIKFQWMDPRSIQSFMGKL